MFETLRKFCGDLVKKFDSVSPERKKVLEKIGDYIIAKQNSKQTAKLIYICTHNSRRSQFGQVWALTAANFYSIPNIASYSGGTEVSAFNASAIAALERAGFKISGKSEGNNPLYHVSYSETEKPIACFSKLFNDPANPRTEFAAIMTCSESEENCPFVPGADLKVSIPYQDPKGFDGTPVQDQKYDDRCRQIALESLYVFSKVSEKILLTHIK